MAEEATKEELEALKKDLEALREDMRGLARAARDEGYERVSEAKKRAEEKYEETLEEGRREIREHPFITVLGALLVGFGIGVLLERK